MRQRTQLKSYSTVPHRYGIYNYSTGSSSTLSLVDSVVDHDYTEMQDVTTPRFKERMGNGEVIVNAMSQYSYRRNSTYGTTEIRNTASKSANRAEHLTGMIMGFKPPIPPEVTALSSSLSTQAVTAAYAGVASPELAGVVSLAELKDTWDLLVSPYKGVQQILRRLEREKAARLRALRKKGVAVDSRPPPPEVVAVLSDLWLKYRYGLIPLMSDIDGIIKSLQKSSGPSRFTARGSASGSWSENGTVVVGPSWGETRTRPWTRNWEVSVRAGVLYEYTSTLESDLGLTLGNLPSAVLDLTRFSFVLDWFVNVSDYVAAMTATLRGDVKGAWATTTVTCSHVSTCTSTFAAPSGSYQAMSLCKGASSSELHAWRSRVPVGMQQIGLAGRLAMTNSRYADAAALLWKGVTSATIPRTRSLTTPAPRRYSAPRKYLPPLEYK